MKHLLAIALISGTLCGIGAGQDGPQPPVHPLKAPRPPRAWLGIDLSKPDETITAHLPALPPGIGFVIRSVEKDGPAEAAGLREYDVLWKLGDQMLVNEGQLAALLRLSKPGDEVALSGFRAGKPLEVRLKLGEAPERKRSFTDDAVEDSILPGVCRGPWRITDFGGKCASYTTDEGRAEIRKDGEIYKVKIQGPKDELIYEGEFAKDSDMDRIPEDWRRRVHALRRGLDHALEGRMTPNRQPRPRVVPPAGSDGNAGAR